MGRYDYNKSGLTPRDKAMLTLDAKRCRESEIREWHARLELAPQGGYHLIDVSREVVVDYVSTLLSWLDEARRQES